MTKRGSLGKLIPFSATLMALLCHAPDSGAQEQQARAQLDPSWTDAPPSEDEERAEPDDESSPAPATPPSSQAPRPAPSLPPSWPPPIPWAGYDRWFRVELSGADPALRFRIYSLAKGADKKVPIHACRNPCRVLLPRGEYRVQVAGRPEQIEGDRRIEVTADTRARFSLPDRGARTGGLALGITGSALAAVGMLVVLLTRWDDYCDACGRDGPDERKPVGLYVGVSMVIVGAVLTPVGWSQFARNRKPRIDQRPLGGAPRKAAEPRIGIGVVPIAGGAAAGFRGTF
jgi:hypothetical protein